MARTRSKRPRLDVWTLQPSFDSFATDTPRTTTYCITMKGSGSHLHAKVPPSTTEGLSSRRVDEYHLVSDPIIASIHYEAFSKHLTSYVEKGLPFPISTHTICPHSRFQNKRTQFHDRSSRSLLLSSSRNSVRTSTTTWSDDRTTRKPSMGQVRLAFLSPNRFSLPRALVPFRAPFLPAQAGFHPKRNQAREKLATLLPPRFQELTSDIRHELGRRYPACDEVVISC